MSIFESVIGILSPPTCISCTEEGSALCDKCALLGIKPFGERCWRCNKLSSNCRTCPACRALGSPSYVWITTDHDELARDLLSLYKFNHQRVAVEPIADLMAKSFLQYNTVSAGYLVVSVPTATARFRERGFGHSELLAKKIALKLRMDYSSALRRLGQNRQLGSKREDRLKQLQGTIAVKNSRDIYGRNILLIDDVVTTGGTILAATKALREAGAKRVDALLFAKHL
jgi:ComF family protein